MADERNYTLNRASGTLASTLGVTDLTITLGSGEGANMPAVPFYGVLDPGVSGKYEVVRVDSRVGDALTIASISDRYLQGSDAASGLSHSAGATFSVRVLSQVVENLHDRIDGVETTADAAYAPGGTDVPVADGGTGASTAAAARTNLGAAADADLTAHEGAFDADHGADHDARDHSTALGTATAADLPNVAAGDIVATDVQAAINELDTEKAALSGATFTGDVLASPTSTQDLGSATLAWADGYINRLLAADGSAASPSFTFGSDTDTGIYRSAADAIGFVTNGVKRLELFADRLHHSDGSAASPSISFLNDTDTGEFLPAGGGQIAWTLGGTERMRLNNIGLRPAADNTYDLATTGLRYKDAYVANGITTTSDMSQKRDVAPRTSALDRIKGFIADSGVISFKWNEGSRQHAGFDADKVGQHFPDSAAFVDPAIKAQAKLDAGPPPQEDDESDEDYAARIEQWNADVQAELNAPKGIRVHELVADLFAAVGELAAEVDRLRARPA